MNEPAIRTEEHTNYHLSSILTDNGYGLKNCGVVGEWNMTEDTGNLPCVGIEDILRFKVADGITRILADIPGKEKLPEQYERAGFHRAYFYRCYHKEEKFSKEQEEKSSKEQED